MDKRIDIRADVIFDDVIILPVEGETTITENGVHDVASYETANVNVPTTSPEPLSVTENGTYTAPEGKAYSPVTVAVPEIELIPLEVDTNPYTAIAPAGKGFSPVSVNIPLGGTLDITENGGYSVVGYSGVNVMVPEIELIPLEVTSNGAIHVAPDGKGYSPVTVNIPLGGTLDITANGGYSVVGYSGVNVMVPETVLIPELNVSQNGTYTAPVGEAYAAVKVNVPAVAEETLIWENPSPNASFVAATLFNNMPLYQYDYFKIVVRAGVGAPGESSFMVKRIPGKTAQIWAGTQSNGERIRKFSITFSDEGESGTCDCGDCVKLGTGEVVNFATLPFRFYGVKMKGATQ